MTSANISAGKITSNLRDWINDTPIVKSILSNPFIIGILIVSIIYLIDMGYGKRFENTQNKEVIQHFTTTYIIVTVGFVLNNLVNHNSKKEGALEIPTIEPLEVSKTNRSEIDNILSDYV